MSISIGVLPKLILVVSAAALFHAHLTFGFLPSSIQRHHLSVEYLSHSVSTSAFLPLYATFQQNPGESDIDFIKRITSTPLVEEQQHQRRTSSSTTTDANVNNSTKPTGTYKRIEEWDAERIAKGELTWEEKVQFEGQRFGNQVKQDNILRHHIGTFF
jgi:hypothetical protein